MALELKSIYKSYGENKVLYDLSIYIENGEKLCIMGESGCGKTTLLHIILGILKPESGEILGSAKKIAAVFQEDRLCESFSAIENVLAVTSNAVTEAEIIKCLDELGLAGFTSLPVRELSGGMRRRVAVARALLAESDIIILDEPFKGLDDATRESTVKTILSRAKGKTIITATHDKRDAELLGARIVEL